MDCSDFEIDRSWIMKLFKRKPPKMIQARFLYDSSKISTYGKHYSDWQIVSEKQF